MSTNRFHRVKFWVLNTLQTLRESEHKLGEKAIISSYILTKGESWALLRKSAQFVVLRQFSHR